MKNLEVGYDESSLVSDGLTLCRDCCSSHSNYVFSLIYLDFGWSRYISVLISD